MIKIVLMLLLFAITTVIVLKKIIRESLFTFLFFH